MKSGTMPARGKASATVVAPRLKRGWSAFRSCSLGFGGASAAAASSAVTSPASPAWSWTASARTRFASAARSRFFAFSAPSSFTSARFAR